MHTTKSEPSPPPSPPAEPAPSPPPPAEDIPAGALLHSQVVRSTEQQGRKSLFVSASAKREPYGLWKDVYHPYLYEMHTRLKSDLYCRNIPAVVSFGAFCQFVYRKSSGEVPSLFLAEIA